VVEHGKFAHSSWADSKRTQLRPFRHRSASPWECARPCPSSAHPLTPPPPYSSMTPGTGAQSRRWSERQHRFVRFDGRCGASVPCRRTEQRAGSQSPCLGNTSPAHAAHPPPPAFWCPAPVGGSPQVRERMSVVSERFAPQMRRRVSGHPNTFYGNLLIAKALIPGSRSRTSEKRRAASNLVRPRSLRWA